MNKTRIYYFSGTGNTKVIAMELLEQFSNFGLDTSLVAIDEFIRKETVIDVKTFRQIDLVGIGFPIHGFMCPDMITEFVKKLPFARGQKAFVFSTSAGNLKINNGGTVKVRQLLRLKGYKVVYERMFAMGANFLYAYDERLTKALYLANIDKSRQMVEQIYEGVTRKTKLNPFLFSLDLLIHRLEEGLGAKGFGIGLKADDSCTLCEKCVRMCPKENIEVADSSLKFNDKCMMCMRCMYICPEDAIQPSSLKRAKLKNQYDIKEIIEDEDNLGNYYEEARKPKFKFLRKYIEDVDL